MREYTENGTMYATERNWVKNTPTQNAPLVEWQEAGQGIKYKKVMWSDGIVWLEFVGWGGMVILVTLLMQMHRELVSVVNMDIVYKII